MAIFREHLVKNDLPDLCDCHIFVELFIPACLFVLFTLNNNLDIIHLFFVPQLQLTTFLLLLKLFDQNDHQLIPCGGGNWQQI
jgi:hypothetical protein